MRFRPLGPSGVLVSELSFGCGALPKDDAESTAVIHAGIEAGCNYFETATFYCDGRCQEKAALGVSGFTERVMVSAKQGVEAKTTQDGYRKELERQLTVLGVDRAEWLQVGWLCLENLPYLTRKGGVLEVIYKAMDEGIIGHIGFTGHDTPDNFSTILRTGIFESMTVTYNLLNRSYAPAIAVAREMGVGVVAMNPVGGGLLATPSTAMQQLIPGDAVTSNASLALRFVLANPGISTACSGMSTVPMVVENAAAVEQDREFTSAERDHMTAILDQFKALGDRFCTGCRYCMPCPNGVDIPTCFHLYNLYNVYGLQDAARRSYAGMEEAKRAAACTRCGECETKCPNKLPIMEQLDTVRGVFEV